MSATPAETNNEYSRAPGGLRQPGRALARVLDGRLESLPTAVAILGGLLLIGAEFSPLYSVHLSTYGSPVRSMTVGSHDLYALVPIAVLAAALALVASRHGNRPALAALSALGVVALGIALIGDLPAARAHGLTKSYAWGANEPGLGFYLETLGAVLLLGAGAVGWVVVGVRASGTRRSSLPPKVLGEHLQSGS